MPSNATAYVLRSMSDVSDRIAMMDDDGRRYTGAVIKFGAPMHLLGHARRESRLERIFNDRMAQVVREIRAASSASVAYHCMLPQWQRRSLCAA